MGRRLGSQAVRALLTCVSLASVAAACNAVNGSHDRELDAFDASSPPSRKDADSSVEGDAGVPLDVVEAGTDAPIDAGPIVIDIPLTQFTTPNGASYQTSAAGVTIIAADAGNYGAHALIMPSPAPSIPSDDFTLHATVRTTLNAEFGLVTRGQAGRVVVWGSKDGVANKPFLTTMSPPAWEPLDPVTGARGPAYTYADTTYMITLRASANIITGKMWDASTPEPSDATAGAVLSDAFTTGRGVGFYTLGPIGAVLEKLSVTVP